MATLTIPPYFQSSSLWFTSKVRFDVRHLVSCLNVLVLTWSVCRTRQSAPSWKRHVHINGTIYYSLETQGQNRLFRRAITEEDITDPDVRRAMEDGCHEYYQWLEEADLDDLPDDLELLIHFDNHHRREPIASLISYDREVKFSCCPMEKEDDESSVASSSYFIIHFALHLNLIYLAPGLPTRVWALKYTESNASG